MAACLMVMSHVSASTKSKKLQVLINFSDPVAFMFALSTGTGITDDVTATRPFGSYSLANGWILPGGTINKNQTSYLVDKHGNPITIADSVGRFETSAKMLAEIDFSAFPAEGTIVEMTDWGLYFNKKCDSETNLIMASGFGKAGTLVSGDSSFSWVMNALEGSGCNKSHNSLSAKMYTSGDGLSSLIEIKFHDDIKYED